MNIRTQSIVLVSLLAAAGCSSVLPAQPQLSSGSTVLAAASSKVSAKRTTFAAWDTNHDGKLSLTEYEDGFLSVLQPPPTADEIPALNALFDEEFQVLDTNQDGYLSYSEFELPTLDQLGQIAPADVLDRRALTAPPTSVQGLGGSAA